jgi:SPP1 family predicted phage head-tail adaptor
MIRTGLLRHKICIQEKVTLRDSMGGEIVTWEPFTYCWAQIEPLSGREYFAAKQAQASISHKMIMRYQSGIKPYHRIQWGERNFNIDAILNPEERNRELTIFCTEAAS